MKKKLHSVTLIAVDCHNYKGAANALKKSMEQCEFASVKFLTDINIKLPGIEVVNIKPIKSKEEYSEFMIKSLNFYFQTEYVLERREKPPLPTFLPSIYNHGAPI